MTPIAPLIEAFLGETLARQRGVSRHTRDSYSLSFQLLFMFAAKRLKVSPSALTLEQLDAGLISDFLEYLEDKRKNAPVTRNVRLAAIKSFFRFLKYRQPAALEHVRRVLAIPFKKTDQRLVPSPAGGAASGARHSGSRHARWHPRPGHAASGGLCGSARVRADGVESRGHRPVVDEHSCPGQGAAGTDASLVEDHGRSPACLARRSRAGLQRPRCSSMPGESR
nr:site-specific integrase [Rhizobium sp. T1473]